MKVIRTFKPQPLRSAKDLRELRGQLRFVSADLQTNPRARFEFIGACTAMARIMLQRPGESECSLAILRDDSYEGLCASFIECLGASSVTAPERMRNGVLSDLPQRGLADIDRLVDQINVDPPMEGRAMTSLVKWIN